MKTKDFMDRLWSAPATGLYAQDKLFLALKQRVQTNVEKMEDGERIALVGIAKGQVVGTVLIEKSQYILQSNRGGLADLVVNPAFQRQGLGKRLCLEICESIPINSSCPVHFML